MKSDPDGSMTRQGIPRASETTAFFLVVLHLRFEVCHPENNILWSIVGNVLKDAFPPIHPYFLEVPSCGAVFVAEFQVRS